MAENENDEFVAVKLGNGKRTYRNVITGELCKQEFDDLFSTKHNKGWRIVGIDGK